MECSQVKGLLSEYLDGMLEKETRALVEEHLSACAACREEHDSLKALLHELGSMDPVAPSADFLERLHERIEQPSRISRLIQTLFVPMRFKIPFEFAAAALVALVIFSILNVQFGAYRTQRAPLQETKGQVVGEKASSKSVPDAFMEEAPVPAIPEPGRMAKGREAGRRPPELAILLTPKRPSPAMESQVLKRSPSSAWQAQRPTAADAVRPESEAAGLAREEAGAGSGVSLSGNKALPSRIFNDVVAREVRNAVITAGGHILPGGGTPQKEASQEVIASIPVKNYPFLLEKLHALGTLQVPRKMPPREGGGSLQVHIKLLPEK